MRLAFLSRIEKIVRSLSPSEKFLFRLFAVLLTISSLSLAWKVNSLSLTQIPKQGGKITEGIVGFPRFINPLIATSNADRDIAALVYSGLMRPSAQGVLVPDLAQSLDISEDGLVYTFQLKQGLTFHDGHPLTATDVAFTLAKVLDGEIKSPKRSDWEGIEVQQAGELEIVFKLPSPYAPFLENTTIGILPKHIWDTTTAEQFPFSTNNMEAVGSGPYKIKSIKRDESGIPVGAVLKSFDDYALGNPYIDELRFLFFTNEADLVDAHVKGRIDSLNSVAPQYADELQNKDSVVNNYPMPRIFAVFFNQNHQGIFADKNVREALSISLNRSQIIDKVLHGYGEVVTSPIPKDNALRVDTGPNHLQSAPNEAEELFASAGWKKNPDSGILEKKSGDKATNLSFTLATSDIPELKLVATEIKKQWGELGVDVRIEIFEIDDLNRNVIKPRKYDALLFGEAVGRALDLYPFWHSSQRADPGLNVALYTNIVTDKLLEEAREETDEVSRTEKLRQFEQEIISDAPAIFLYAPDFIYITPSNIKNLKIGQTVKASERFMNVHEWYIEEEGVWPIFTTK